MEVLVGLIDAPGLPNTSEAHTQEPNSFTQHPYVKDEPREHPVGMNGRGDISGRKSTRKGSFRAEKYFFARVLNMTNLGIQATPR